MTTPGILGRVRRITTAKDRAIREREGRLVLGFLSSSRKQVRLPALEVGCGEGTQSLILGEAYEVISIDILKKRKHYSFPFVLASYEFLPFRDKSFRLVYSSNVLEHISNRIESLREGKRVLETGGNLVTVVPTAFWKCLEMLLWPAILVANLIVRLEARQASLGLLTPSALIHGKYSSNRDEYYCYRLDSWAKLHLVAGLQDLDVKMLIGYLPVEVPVPLEYSIGRISPVGVAILSRKGAEGIPRSAEVGSRE